MAIVTTSPLLLQIGSASITRRFLVADTTMVFESGPFALLRREETPTWVWLQGGVDF
jgi:hypothetical protein